MIANPCGAASLTCSASRKRTEAGTAAGASISSMAPGRCSAPSTRPASISTRRACGGRSIGCCRSRTRMGDGARATPATTSSTRATGPRPARPPRPPGRSSASWRPGKSTAGGRARHCVPAQDPGRGRLLARGALHGDGLSARLLPALSRLSEVLPALGPGPLPQPEKRQRPYRHGRDVSPALGSSPSPVSRPRPGSLGGPGSWSWPGAVTPRGSRL